jgi:hypothetical protein
MGGGYVERDDEQHISGKGMLIDLTTPAIKWGNGNFAVDENGNVTLAGDIIWGAGASPT